MYILTALCSSTYLSTTDVLFTHHMQLAALILQNQHTTLTQIVGRKIKSLLVYTHILRVQTHSFQYMHECVYVCTKILA